MPYKIQPYVPQVTEEYPAAAIPTSYRSSVALAEKEARRLANLHGVQYQVLTPGGRYVKQVTPEQWLVEHVTFVAQPDRIFALLALGFTPEQALAQAEAEYRPHLMAHAPERVQQALLAREAVTA